MNALRRLLWLLTWPLVIAVFVFGTALSCLWLLPYWVVTGDSATDKWADFVRWIDRLHDELLT